MAFARTLNRTSPPWRVGPATGSLTYSSTTPAPVLGPPSVRRIRFSLRPAPRSNEKTYRARIEIRRPSGGYLSGMGQRIRFEKRVPGRRSTKRGRGRMTGRNSTAPLYIEMATTTRTRSSPLSTRLLFSAVVIALLPCAATSQTEQLLPREPENEYD